MRLAVLACVLAGSIACDRQPARPPVILVSVDTLRSDHLALYGAEGVPTPALEALRADGVLYQHAYAPLPLTLPAHLTALTGSLPSQHGVRDNGGFRFDASDHSYLPQRLHDLGYATGAFVSSFVLRGNSGMAAGFDVYDDDLSTAGSSPFGTLQRSGAETIERALDWVEGSREEPFFLFLHLYEPHLPYTAPAEFATRFANPYAAEVAYADSLLAGFFARLRELGLYEPALVIFMSDHGEGLGDHRYQEHGLLLYREALQVPLIVKAPGAKGAGATVEAAVQLADIAPTVERWVGLETDPSLEGRPLQEADSDTVRAIIAETFLPRLHYGWSELSSVIEFPYHLIWGPQPELYDLANDPAEQDDIFDTEPDIVQRLVRARRRYDWSVPRPGTEDEQTLANLEALGYLTSAPSHEEATIDPKSRLHIIERLNRATTRFRAGEREPAITEFRQIVAEAPEIIDAWESLGKSLLQLGRTDEAVEALEEAMRRSGGRPLVAIALANAHWKAGNLEAARRNAEIAVTTQDLAHGLLAQIALKQNDLPMAERHIDLAIDIPPIRDQALLTRAELELKRERGDAALATLAEIGGGSSLSLPELEIIRGRALARLNRFDEAEAAFLRQLERYPRVLDGYTYLAYFYSVRENGPALGRTLQSMVETNPTPAAYAAAVKTLRLIGDARSAEQLLRYALGRWPEAPRLLRLRTRA